MQKAWFYRCPINPKLNWVMGSGERENFWRPKGTPQPNQEKSKCKVPLLHGYVLEIFAPGIFLDLSGSAVGSISRFFLWAK